MDDISSRISELLNSPDGMDRIKAAAESILGNSAQMPEITENKTENNTNNHQFSIPEGLLDNLGNMQGIMRIMNLLQNKKQDKRAGLLLALKPHLSEERAKRVDKAVSLLKIADLLPILKEEGLFDSLGLL